MTMLDAIANMTPREAWNLVREPCAQSNLEGLDKALSLLEPADPQRQVDRWRAEADDALTNLRRYRVQVLGVAIEEHMERHLLRETMNALRTVKAIDKTVANAIARTNSVYEHAEFLAFRYELRRETAWLELAQFPTLGTLKNEETPSLSAKITTTIPRVGRSSRTPRELAEQGRVVKVVKP